jgi:hypothetical protein
MSPQKLGPFFCRTFKVFFPDKSFNLLLTVAPSAKDKMFPCHQAVGHIIELFNQLPDQGDQIGRIFAFWAGFLNQN